MIHQQRWTLPKIAARLDLMEPLVYRRRHELPPFRLHLIEGSLIDSPHVDPPIAPDVDDSQWPVVEPHSYWGRWRTDFVLRNEFSVPADWDPDQPVALYLPLGDAGDFSHPEALVHVDGHPFAACDRHHQEIRLRDDWRDDQTHALALHGWTGLGGFGSMGKPNSQLYMQPCAVVQIDQPTRDFHVLARVAHGIAAAIDENEPARSHLLNALDAAFRVLDIREAAGVEVGDAFYASVAQAHAILREGVARAGAPLDVDLFAAGHAHIDVAWLWTLGQTQRKTDRTFHTVLRLMEQFPHCHFTQSQPQLYDYVRRNRPELFTAIQERVAEGRWEATGGMWVEADCNVSGPESLARQFLLGRRFYREHFGRDVDTPILWLPDVFGYAWNLPQLIKLAGLDYFFTIKIGWSQYNRMPYDSFWWQGLDGTRVLTHYSTTPDPSGTYVSTYNAEVTPGQVIGTWTAFQQKEQSQEVFMGYGYGDGGGGPTREMLENIEVMQSFPATPRVQPGRAIDFFRQLHENAGNVLPVWKGELYLELHRGTYTTQSRNKRANRKSEFLLHDAEFVATLAAMLSQPPTANSHQPSYTYPHDDLNRAWELVCLNQFHDIIPGSSINAVYLESLGQYEEVREIGTRVRDEALTALAETLGANPLLINPTSFARRDLAFWPDGDASRLPDALPSQETTVDGARGLLIDPGEVAPYSVSALADAADAARRAHPLSASSTHLENEFLRVEINQHGDIIRIYDKQHAREVLPPGGIANQFEAFEDRPLNWDAWDIDIFYDDKRFLADAATSVQVVESGPLRATVEIKRRILHSDYTQRISLAHHSPRLDFDTVIDWRERHVLLKVAFPVDVFTPTATYEVQWGNVERPTHRNTSWDWARFETAAQKWVDVSEGDYGVSLLNDCKHGHDVQDLTNSETGERGVQMRISLLRSPTFPDPEADLGQHRFAYSLLPHGGDWRTNSVMNPVAQAYALNDPLLVHTAPTPIATATSAAPSGNAAAFLAVDRPNVVIETVKRAEEGEGVIVRLYECGRTRGPVALRAGFDFTSVQRVNLIEDEIEGDPLTVDGRTVTFDLRPYEIVTLRLA